ncbi:hypothetical protein MTO96_000018 [Rhipicephalus appendiculatus]
MHDKGSNSRPLRERLDDFLLAYRTTPNTATGKSPAELFLKRTLRTNSSQYAGSNIATEALRQPSTEDSAGHREAPTTPQEAHPDADTAEHLPNDNYGGPATNKGGRNGPCQWLTTNFLRRQRKSF